MLKGSRAMRGIECTLRRGVESAPYPKYNREKLESYVQDIQQILGTLHAPRLSLVENHSGDECITTPTPETGMNSLSGTWYFSNFFFVIIMTFYAVLPLSTLFSQFHSSRKDNTRAIDFMT